MDLHRFLAHLPPDEQVAFACAYPFPQSTRSFLYANGRATPLLTGDTADFPGALVQGETGPVPVEAVLTGAQQASLFEARFPALGVGSNASPEQLARKYAGTDDVIPTIRAQVADHSVVYAAHLTGYGSVPATLHHTPGARVQVFVNYLTAHQRDVMDRTETLGHHYAHTELRGLDIVLETGERPELVSAYIAIQGVLARNGEAIALADIPHPTPLLPALDQWAMQEHLRRQLAPERDLASYVLDQVRARAVREAREAQFQPYTIPTRIAPSR